MILVIDNYDSFVYNLARYVEIAGARVKVLRNTDITLEEIAELNPSGIILSPGPCTPDEAGICVEAVKKFGETIPILGVCLGHQCIAQAYGAQVTAAKSLMHGKTSTITHNGQGLFKNLPESMTVGRYHSLAVSTNSASALEVYAYTEDGEIMAIAHKEHPVYGVQFHPESVLTDHGHEMIEAFLNITSAQAQIRQAA